MKQFIAVTIVLAIILFSCTKTVTNTQTVTVTIHDTTTVTIKDTIRSNFDYFTAHTWMYTSYYIGYVDSAHLGIAQYIRGSTGNIINFDNVRTTFNPDGTVIQINQDGSGTPGTWRFFNLQQTQYAVVNSGGTFIGTFIRLDSKHYDFVYHASDGTDRYGTLVPAQ